MGQLPASVEATAFAAGALMMVLGLYLRWRLHEYRMMTEERAKDGDLTEMQARRRIEILRFSGPIVVLIGLGLFLAIFLG